MPELYWSATTNSFHSDVMDGPRTLLVDDPTWQPYPDQANDTPPQVEVPNPHTTIPSDAVAISEHQREQLLEGQNQGLILTSDESGYPILEERPPFSLEELAAQKRREINAASVEALAAVRNEYPDYEQLSWERQEREALEGGGPLIESIATARGLELSELIERILEKSNRYQQAAGNVIGRRQALEDLIAAALKNGDRDSIQSVSW